MMDYFWHLFGPELSSLMFTLATLQRLIPDSITSFVDRLFRNLLNLFNARVEIAFDEYPLGSFSRSKAYAAIETYLGSSISAHADSLRASVPEGTGRVALSMDDHEKVVDVYGGVAVTWMRTTSYPRSNVISFKGDEERRAYVLSFRRRHRGVVVGEYLNHVFTQGKAIGKRNRRQRLYTNVSGDDARPMWDHVSFEHPATFDTLAMDPAKKKEIVDDLVEFTKSRDYYRQIGKPWKRGYLLYGPPGTGKSTMVAAMANYLHYDVYDLELTAVKDNTHLRKLMIEISKRAIVVIEDIDCSLGITTKRSNTNNDDDEDENDLKKFLFKKAKADDDDDEEEGKKSKVTLSGLLNFMDGLWSASGGERVFVFTTNYVEKLDPALIRRGRMDKHIEMSYCGFEAFKVLANNYLKLGPDHEKFDEIRDLLESGVNMSPADVADHLMPKSADTNTDECLENLIAALKKANEESGKRKAGDDGGEKRCCNASRHFKKWKARVFWKMK